MKRDKALREARETIAQLCECGDFNSDHYGPYDAALNATGECGADGCKCRKFKRDKGLQVMRRASRQAVETRR